MSLAHRALVLFVGQAINVLVGFVFLPYLARSLSYEEYGAYRQTIDILALAKVVFALGLPQVLFLVLHEDQVDHPQVQKRFNVLFWLSVLVGGIGMATVLLGAPIWSELMAKDQVLVPYLWLFAPSCLFAIMNLLVGNAAIVVGRVKGFATAMVVSNLLKVMMVVMAIQLTGELWLALLGILFSQALQFILLIRLLPRKLFGMPSLQGAGQDLRKGVPLGLSQLVSIAFLQTDSFMVSRMEGREAFAVFKNGALEIPFVSTLYNSVSAVILPRVTKLIRDGRRLEVAQLKRRLMSQLATMVFPVAVFFIVFSEPIVVAVFSEQYKASAPIFSLYTVVVLFRITSYNEVPLASGRSGLILFNTLLLVAVNLGLNLAFIPLWGIKGAALASTLSYLVSFATMSFWNLRLLGCKPAELFPLVRLASMATLSLGLTWLAYWLFSQQPSLPMLGLCAAGAIGVPPVLFIRLGWVEAATLRAVAERVPPAIRRYLRVPVRLVVGESLDQVRKS